MDAPTHGHDPVLLQPVLAALNPQPGETMVDCTVGRAGHAQALLERLTPGGTLIVLDVDPDNLAYARQRLAPLIAPMIDQGANLRCFHANFGEIHDVLDQAGIDKVDGLLADLGVSTNQLLEKGKGLSFDADEPLDMRLDPRISKTAADLLRELPEREIADLIYLNAQERYSFRIARKIVATRDNEPIRTTGQLARLVRSVVPGKWGQIDPATRTFQALRIAVNGEMDCLQDLLDAIPDVMKTGGRVAMIAFHSGEDRLVKTASKQWSAEGRCQLQTKKPVEADELELQKNPRSRSAKLRAWTWTA